MARAVVIPIAGTAGGNEHLLELKNPTGLKAKMDQIVVGHHLVLEIPEGEILEDAAVDPFERRTEPLNARPELKRPKSAEQLFCLSTYYWFALSFVVAVTVAVSFIFDIQACVYYQ